jgi:hypothetical protein
MYRLVLRIIYPGSDFFPSQVPDPRLTRSRVWILVNEFRIFNLKHYYQVLQNKIRNVHPGSRI